MEGLFYGFFFISVSQVADLARTRDKSAEAKCAKESHWKSEDIGLEHMFSPDFTKCGLFVG
jgi:hypothetical protein